MPTLNELAAAERKRRGLDTPPAAPIGTPHLHLVGNDDPRAARWVAVKLDRTVEALSAMGADSGRNAALNAAAYSLGHYVPKWLDEQTVRDHLLVASMSNGLVADDGQRACDATINSGLTSGMEEPRDPNITQDTFDDFVTGKLVVDTATGEVTQAPEAPSEAPSGPTEPPREPLDPEAVAQRAHGARVALELMQLRARHDAKQAHTAELAARDFRAPAYTHTLTEELAIPDEPVTYAVNELLPSGGNALLAAAFKTGKTTTLNNLLRSYADGVPFLGRFDVNPGAGRIAIFNYELDASMNRRWLREIGIVNTDRVAVLNLRGHRLPLTSPPVEDWVVAWMLEHDVTFWIADPFARAATGVDENSNTEVGVWLDTFDVIKQRAGISDAVLATHTGRAEMEAGRERARGATRLDDWADVRWLLTRDEDDNRFFRATGRDVEIDEAQLTFSKDDRSLTIGGGDRRWVKNRAISQKVLDWINENPGQGVRAIQAGVGGKKDAVDSARVDLVRRHKVRVEDGPNNSQLHYANESQS